MLPASLFDGRSAARQEVSLSLADDALLVHDHTGAIIDAWPLREIELVDHSGDTLRFSRRTQPEMRLVLQRANAEMLPLPGQSKTAVSRRLVAWVGSALALALIVYFGGGPAVGVISRLVPMSLERRIGNFFLPTLVGEDRQISSEDDTFKDLMHRLAADDTRVHLIDAPTENAFALPGGDIVLYCGLVQKMRSPDELAGVLAHEATHVARHHTTEALLRVFGTSLLLGAAVGDFSGMAGGAWQSADSLLRLQGSRKNEDEADRGALDRLAKAHISAAGFADLFDRLDAKGGTFTRELSFLSTHPSSATRRDLARQRANENSVETAPALSENAFGRLHAACGGWVE